MSFLESARRDLSVGEVSKRSAPNTIWEDVLGDALSENDQNVHFLIRRQVENCHFQTGRYRVRPPKREDVLWDGAFFVLIF